MKHIYWRNTICIAEPAQLKAYTHVQSLQKVRNSVLYINCTIAVKDGHTRDNLQKWKTTKVNDNGNKQQESSLEGRNELSSSKTSSVTWKHEMVQNNYIDHSKDYTVMS